MTQKERRFVAIELVGGLGNQLFGYFAGLYLAQKLGVDLKIYEGNRQRGETIHSSSLRAFVLNFGEFTTRSECFTFSTSLRLLLRKTLEILGLPKFRAESVSKLYTSKVIGFDPNLDNLTPGFTIQGYFQTYSYKEQVIHNSSLSCSPLTLRNPSPWFLELYEQALEEKPVTLHIRRGDYSKPNNFDIGLLGSDYFLGALDAINTVEQKTSVPLWIFSDDLNEAKRIFTPPSKFNVSWIQPPPESNPAESMILMSLGSQIIISNSTYSWWAAAFSGHNDVIAPSKWFRNKPDPEGLIPPQWRTARSYWI